MKSSRFYVVLFLIFLSLITSSLAFGSTYTPSVPPDTTCPFGFFLGFRHRNFYQWDDSTYDPYPDLMWDYYINPLLDTLESLNVEWVEINADAGSNVQYDIGWTSRHPKFKQYSFARFNSILKYCEDHFFKVLLVTYPCGNYYDSIIDTNNVTIIQHHQENPKMYN